MARHTLAQSSMRERVLCLLRSSVCMQVFLVCSKENLSTVKSVKYIPHKLLQIQSLVTPYICRDADVQIFEIIYMCSQTRFCFWLALNILVFFFCIALSQCRVFGFHFSCCLFNFVVLFLLLTHLGGVKELKRKLRIWFPPICKCTLY